MHIGVWKSLIFLQASRQKKQEKEGSGWRFTKNPWPERQKNEKKYGGFKTAIRLGIKFR
jgi:hypothetical protein